MLTDLNDPHGACVQDVINWLNATPWSIALRESLYVWPVLEASHVLTLMLFVGTIIMVDLRLLGLAFPSVALSEMTARILPWTIAGFALMVFSGLLLFYAKPLVYYHSLFFRLKLLIMILALGNVVFFHQYLHRLSLRANPLVGPSTPIRISAATSLFAWLVVIVLGRLVAYDWLNCDKLDDHSLHYYLASCSAFHAIPTD